MVELERPVRRGRAWMSVKLPRRRERGRPGSRRGRHDGPSHLIRYSCHGVLAATRTAPSCSDWSASNPLAARPCTAREAHLLGVCGTPTLGSSGCMGVLVTSWRVTPRDQGTWQERGSAYETTPSNLHGDSGNPATGLVVQTATIGTRRLAPVLAPSGDSDIVRLGRLPSCVLHYPSAVRVGTRSRATRATR